MDEDWDDDLPLAHICNVVIAGMDSVLLRYPTLWGLPDLYKSDLDYTQSVVSSLPDDFESQFKMSRTSFEDLVTKLARVSKIRGIENKLLFTLWMLQRQDSYELAGKRFHLSKSSGHLAFTEIVDAILKLYDDYVKWPSASEYLKISQSFKERNGEWIPGIIGAIDACHFRIKKPKEDAATYYNAEEKYSIILQAVCDHRMLFTNVCVGSPGSFSDSAVFHESDLGKDIDRLIPGEYHLVGSRSYPLLQNLVTPFPTYRQTTDRKMFNKILGKSAVAIVQAIDTLKGRFGKLEYLDTSSPELASKIICSCITLHNHILMHDCEDVEVTESMDVERYLASWTTGERRQDRHTTGITKRDYLKSLCQH